MARRLADQPRKHESTKPMFFSCFRVFVAMLLALTTASAVAAQQTFTGRLSDSTCAASHRLKAAADTDRQCLLACIKALAKYVLVDQNNQVIPIANQDAMGLPLYAGRPVKITGEQRGGSIVVARVEAIPAHLHIGHVMTNWRDTPGGRGFLPVAVDETRVAVQHATLAAASANLDDIRLHAGHVLHALDPAVQPAGPGAGYGVKKAAAGALQHLDFAAKADGATSNVTTHATQASSSLSAVTALVDQAIDIAQRARSAAKGDDAARLAADLAAVTRRISDGLQPAVAEMNLMLKAEGLLGAPR